MPLTSRLDSGILPTDSVSSTEIADGTIVDADISPSAGIAVSKLASLASGNTVVTTDSEGHIGNADVDVSTTVLNYLTNVTSDVQGQIDGKLTASLVTAAALTVLDDATVSAMVDTLGGASSTGTGGLARATSPTFVTPTLGVASATSINFGGTALANYVEGTFTPTVTLVGGAGNTVPVYVTNSGRYTRIGNKCQIIIHLESDGGAEGAGTGQINIALPIAAASGGGTTLTVSGDYSNGVNGILVGQIDASATTVQLYYYNTISSRTALTGADQITGGRRIDINMWYEV